MVTMERAPPIMIVYSLRHSLFIVRYCPPEADAPAVQILPGMSIFFPVEYRTPNSRTSNNELLVAVISGLANEPKLAYL
jgi:hypothetical protein